MFLNGLDGLTKPLLAKAPIALKATSAADAIAKPLPTAAVVLPAASKASVLSLTSSPN